MAFLSRNAFLAWSAAISGGVALFESCYVVWPSLPPVDQLQAVTDQTRQEFLDVCGDMRIGKEVSKYFLFPSPERDITASGVPTTKKGVLFGIPAGIFNVKSSDDVLSDPDRFLVAGRRVQWHSDTGRALADSLVLSENARKFAIAQKIAYVKKYGTSFPVALAPFCSATILLSFTFVKYASSYTIPMATIAGLMCATAFYYLAMYAIVENLIELKADKQAARLGPEYVAGGVEYYRKRGARENLLKEFIDPDSRLLQLNRFLSRFISPYATPEDKCKMIKNALKDRSRAEQT